MSPVFRWNEWNVTHIADHGVTPTEAERIVENASSPYPESRGEGKWRVVGRGVGDRLLQVVYIVDVDDTLYVIHAMPLSDRDKRRHRRRNR